MGYVAAGFLGLGALPSDFRGIPVVAGPNTVWIGNTQSMDGREVRFSIQGGNFVLSGATSGIPIGECVAVQGTVYYDARSELFGGRTDVIQTIDVTSWRLAKPEEYLSDSQGRPSGITRCGALATVHEVSQVQQQAGEEAYQEAVSSGASTQEATAARQEAEAAYDLGAVSQAAQAYLDDLARQAGQPVGPGPGVRDPGVYEAWSASQQPPASWGDAGYPSDASGGGGGYPADSGGGAYGGGGGGAGAPAAGVLPLEAGFGGIPLPYILGGAALLAVVALSGRRR